MEPENGPLEDNVPLITTLWFSCSVLIIVQGVVLTIQSFLAQRVLRRAPWYPKPCALDAWVALPSEGALKFPANNMQKDIRIHRVFQMFQA